MTQLPAGAPEPQRFRVFATVSAGTEVGPTRSQNQDAIMVAGAVGVASGSRLSWQQEVGEAGLAVAVVDGMGGHAGGADAAAVVATALTGLDPDPAGWDAWFDRVSQRVAGAGDAWGTPDMGATAAVLRLTPWDLTMANVGDCRIYRAVGGRLGQLSVDDRTEDPSSSVVTQALGGSRHINAHLWTQGLMGGAERFVLCSDGVWGTLEPAVLRDLCAADRPPGQIVDAIAASIYAQNADDNCSVVVLDLVATPLEQPPAPADLPAPQRYTSTIGVRTVGQTDVEGGTNA